MFDRIELRVFTDKRAACGDEVLPDAVYYALTFGDGFYFRFVGTIEDILDAFLFVLRTCFHDTGGYLFVVQSAGDTRAAGVVAFLLRHDVVVEIDVESDLFFSGMSPAVNVGLSVSRVGGAAQTKAMKKASGSVRIDLAQYREMEVFTQFSSDLDDATKAQLAYGGCLMELLKQPLCNPLKLHEQVITLWTATHKKMVHVDKKDVKQYQKDLLAYFDNVYPEIGKEIDETGLISDELGEKILQVADEFKDRAATN